MGRKERERTRRRRRTFGIEPERRLCQLISSHSHTTTTRDAFPSPFSRRTNKARPPPPRFHLPFLSFPPLALPHLSHPSRCFRTLTVVRRPIFSPLLAFSRRRPARHCPGPDHPSFSSLPRSPPSPRPPERVAVLRQGRVHVHQRSREGPRGELVRLGRFGNAEGGEGEGNKGSC